MAKPDKTKNLLNVLNQKVEDKTPPQEPAVLAQSPAAPPPAAENAQRRPKAAKERRQGRDQHFWLHDEDRRVIRELAGWIGVQGERASDSRIVRAALHLARTGDAFLRAYRQVSELDARLTKQDIQSG